MAKNYSNANNSDKNAQSKNGAFSSYSESQNSSKNCDKNTTKNASRNASKNANKNADKNSAKSAMSYGGNKNCGKIRDFIIFLSEILGGKDSHTCCSAENT